jgi:hypothetical protein
MGFIEETGAARYLRDARIAPIYEGTNGIQAIDLVTRKLPLSGGAEVRSLIAELKSIADDVRGSNRDGFGTTADRLDSAIAVWKRRPTGCWRELAAGNAAKALSGATPISAPVRPDADRLLSRQGRSCGSRGWKGGQPHRALPLRRRKPARRNIGTQGHSDDRRRQPCCRQIRSRLRRLP